MLVLLCGQIAWLLARCFGHLLCCLIWEVHQQRPKPQSWEPSAEQRNATHQADCLKTTTIIIIKRLSS